MQSKKKQKYFQVSSFSEQRQMSNDSKEEYFLEKNPKIYNARVSEVLEKYYAVFYENYYIG